MANTTWVHSSTAARSLGVARAIITDYVNHGMLRAEIREEKAGDALFIFSEDVAYCLQCRKAGGFPAGLVRRGLFPPVLDGADGVSLIAWAREQQRFDLTGGAAPDLSIPEEYRRNLPEDEDPPPSHAEARLDKLERTVLSLMATLGPAGMVGLLPDAEKLSLLERLEEVAWAPTTLQYSEALSLLETLRGLSSAAVHDLADWCRAHAWPQRHAVMVIAAKVLCSFFQSLPAAQYAGSGAHRLHQLARTTWARLADACVSSDAMHRASGLGNAAVLPLGYCPTDHRIVEEIRKLWR